MDEGMKDYQKRVVEEKSELDSKLQKLRQFIAGIGFTGIDPKEQSRMIRQSLHMTEYSNVLLERIEAFEA